MNNSEGAELIRSKGRAFLTEVWNKRDFALLNEILDERVVLHIKGERLTSSHDHLTRVINGWHERYLGFHFDIEALIVEGEMASVMAMLHGSPIDDEKRDPVAVRHVFVFRFESGRIVEAWELNDFN